MFRRPGQFDQQGFQLGLVDIHSQVCFGIAQQNDGVLWFGTDNGLSRYDGKSWTTYNQTTGLLENNVYTIVTLDNGDIWIGTKRGVSRIGH